MKDIFPILIDGREAGTLHIFEEGIRTAFHAECDDPGRIVRLMICGESEFYLGVMIPHQDGRLHLDKKLSRLEMQGFPKEIRFAAPESDIKPNEAESALEIQRAEPVIVKDENPLLSEETDCTAETEESRTKNDDSPSITWRKGAGGALAGSCGDLRFLAVPLKSGIAPVGENFVRRVIENTEYAVFEIQKGIIK